jgi:hypothetical protein
MVVVALARAGSNLSIGAENQTGRFPIGWLSAALTLVLLCGFVLVHHSAVTVTGLHRSTEIGNGLTAWVQEESPVHTWAEFGGVWQRPGRAGHFLLTSARPFVEVDVELGSLTRSEVAVDFHGGRADGSARPDAPLTATLGLNHGWRSGETYAYHCRLWAERGISPAIRGGSRDERLLGVFLRIARLGFSDASE